MLEIYRQCITLNRLCWTVWTFDAPTNVSLSISGDNIRRRGNEPIHFAEFL